MFSPILVHKGMAERMIVLVPNMRAKQWTAQSTRNSSPFFSPFKFFLGYTMLPHMSPSQRLKMVKKANKVAITANTEASISKILYLSILRASKKKVRTMRKDKILRLWIIDEMVIVK